MTESRKRYVIEILVLYGVAIFWFFLGEMKIMIVLSIGCIGYLNYSVYELKAKLEEHNKETD